MMRFRLSEQFTTVIRSFALCVGCLWVSVPWAHAAPPIPVGHSSGAALIAMQAQPASSPAADKDAVARGEIWFYQRCAICHVDRIDKDVTYKQILGPYLMGTLKNATPAREATARELIKAGTLRMPGYKYSLSDRELDELMAFLKTH